MAEICPLYSGSTGNSYFIGAKNAGILVDVGRSARQTVNILKRCSIDPLAVAGILITHEHTDHVNGLRVFASKYQIPVFASVGTLTALESMGIADGSFPTYSIEDTLQIGDMQRATENMTANVIAKHPGVAAAQAVGRARGIGTVDVYVAAQEGVPDEVIRNPQNDYTKRLIESVL